jgi:hypothetical protein
LGLNRLCKPTLTKRTIFELRIGTFFPKFIPSDLRYLGMVVDAQNPRHIYHWIEEYDQVKLSRRSDGNGSWKGRN